MLRTIVCVTGTQILTPYHKSCTKHVRQLVSQQTLACISRKPADTTGEVSSTYSSSFLIIETGLHAGTGTWYSHSLATCQAGLWPRVSRIIIIYWTAICSVIINT